MVGAAYSPGRYPREGPRPDVPTGIPRFSELISSFLAVRHTLHHKQMCTKHSPPATFPMRFLFLGWGWVNQSLGHFFSRFMPAWAGRGTASNLPGKKSAGRQCCGWGMFCAHLRVMECTIRATGDEKFQKTPTKLRRFRAGRPIFDAATLLP